ncbi:YveK family protein [Jeotgalibacillus proteolyticus]|uniref:YveK family protein n=1 Tax=Jeotgalibacillus proteolyticus TaxID=2082395 RepID=UPI003CFA68BB
MGEGGIRKSLVRDINLLEYMNVLKKKLWIIVLVVLAATTAGYYYSQSNNVSLFQSSTRVIISSDSEYMKTLMVMIKDPIIMAQVIEDLQLQISPQGLAGKIGVSRIDESQVVQILVTDTDPQKAAEIANATAQRFKESARSILAFEEVQLLSEATVNPSPINESQNRSVVMAAAIGLLAGVGLAFFLESLDGTIRREKEVEEILGIPVIGIVPNLNKKKLFLQKKQITITKTGGEIVDIKQKAAGSDR